MLKLKLLLSPINEAQLINANNFMYETLFIPVPPDTAVTAASSLLVSWLVRVSCLFFQSGLRNQNQEFYLNINSRNIKRTKLLNFNQYFEQKYTQPWLTNISGRVVVVVVLVPYVSFSQTAALRGL